MILLWVIVILMAVVFCVTLALFHMGVCRDGGYRARKILHGSVARVSPSEELLREGAEEFYARGAERVTITSADGIELCAYYQAAENAKRTVLLSHSYRSSGVSNFAPLLEFYHENGCNILAIDHRAHGQSGGRYICFGLKARRDLPLWAEYLNSRPDGGVPVYLVGVSMGASVVTMASALPFPGNVLGLVADCGYTSPWDELIYVLKKLLHLPVFPFLYLADIFARVTIGESFHSVSAAEELAKTRIPALFIHGTADKLVPPEMSRINRAACASDARLELFEGAPHGFSSVLEPERYRALLLDFFCACENARAEAEAE